MKKLKKVFMLLKDPDPCKECLVKVICTEECKPKCSWNMRENSFLLPFLATGGMIIIIGMLYCFFVTLLLLRLGWIKNDKALRRFDPFPHDVDMYDTFY